MFVDCTQISLANKINPTSRSTKENKNKKTLVSRCDKENKKFLTNSYTVMKLLADGGNKCKTLKTSHIHRCMIEQLNAILQQRITAKVLNDAANAPLHSTVLRLTIFDHLHHIFRNSITQISEAENSVLDVDS